MRGGSLAWFGRQLVEAALAHAGDHLALDVDPVHGRPLVARELGDGPGAPKWKPQCSVAGMPRKHLPPRCRRRSPQRSSAGLTAAGNISSPIRPRRPRRASASSTPSSGRLRRGRGVPAAHEHQPHAIEAGRHLVGADLVAPPRRGWRPPSRAPPGRAARDPHGKVARVHHRLGVVHAPPRAPQSRIARRKPPY